MSRGQKDLLQLRIILRMLLDFLCHWFLVQVARFSSPILWNCFLFLRPGVTSWWGLAPRRQKQWQLDQRPSLSEGRKIHKKKYTKCLLSSWTEDFFWENREHCALQGGSVKIFPVLQITWKDKKFKSHHHIDADRHNAWRKWNSSWFTPNPGSSFWLTRWLWQLVDLETLVTDVRNLIHWWL